MTGTNISHVPLTGAPKVISRVQGNRRLILQRFPNGEEVLEEYDIKSNLLLLRKKRQCSTLGDEATWTVEVGETNSGYASMQSQECSFSIVPTTSSPFMIRRDTLECFEWRIRNLPYPPSVYSIAIDDKTQQILIKTSNNKYYKRIAIPDLSVVHARLDSSRLSWKHQYNTLLISYSKPKEVIEHEKSKIASSRMQCHNVK
eukprot:GHVT01002522.1.p1 GENE.GHVT01002522.1~~GHVT01002522.1.p1  ORF type:complete len:201 (+),score=4.14 GHVT01002522.1:1996-2598(+)